MQLTVMLKNLTLFGASSMVLSARLPVRDDSVTVPVVRDTSSSEITSRATNGRFTTLFCTPVAGQPWQRVEYGAAFQAIADLCTDGPGVGIDPGPGFCERLNCFAGMAIYWCNDNTVYFQSDTGHLGDMAEHIANACYKYIPGSGAFTRGQLFDSWNYNIILQAETCDDNKRRTVKREELMARVEGRETEVSHPVARDFDSLDTRAAEGVSQAHFCSPCCGQPWGVAESASVSQAINELTKNHGDSGINAGPGHCEQLACMWGAAIWWCNDNPFFKSMPTERLVQMSQALQGLCYHFEGSTAYTGGQIFDSENFNVIIQQQNCEGSRRIVKREELIAQVEAREADVSVPVVPDELASRTSDGNPAGLLCIKNGIPGQDWTWVAVNGPIDDSVLALRNRGVVNIDAGPGHCEQVACTESAAIYLCNDNNHAISVDSWHLGSMARDIISNCWVVTDLGEFTGGQTFDSDGYNLIINRNQCQAGVLRAVKREELMNPAPAPLEERDADTALPIIRNELDSRGTFQGFFCIKDILAQPWAWVNINDGIKNVINNFRIGFGPRQISTTAGPANCVQIACANNAAIWWCNDNDHTVVADVDHLADMAQHILDSCSENGGPFLGGNTYSGGQLFDSDGYNIIVDSDWCRAGRRVKREELMSGIEARDPVVLDESPIEGRDAGVDAIVPDVLASRATDGGNDGFICVPVPGQNWQRALVPSVYKASAALRAEGPNTGMDAGPGRCSQMQCYQGAAIYWCNDNDHYIETTTARLADMAEYIIGQCYQYVPRVGTFVGGQLFDSDGYNVIVQQATCEPFFGDPHTLGDREELMAQLDARDADADVTPINPKDLASRAEAGEGTDLQCIPQLEGWEYADYQAVMWGSTYLQAINRPIYVDPYTCLKVWCTGGSGIYVCNPNAYVLNVPSMTIASLVSTIANACHFGDITGGQIWDTVNFFVQVHGGGCEAGAI